MSIETLHPSSLFPDEEGHNREIDEYTSGQEINERKKERTEHDPIVEEFQEKRAGMLQKIAEHRLTKIATVWTPGIDAITLGTYAAMGKKLDGEKMNAKARFNYVGASIFLAASYGLFLSGNPKEALTAKGLYVGFAVAEIGPKIISKVMEFVKAEDKDIRVANFFQKTAEFLDDRLGTDPSIYLNLASALETNE